MGQRHRDSPLGRLTQRTTNDETVTHSDWIAIPVGQVI